MSERIERLKHLLSKYPEPWVIEKEPHPYNDGTKEFTHVRYKAKHLGHEVIVSIGNYVTPDLAELLVLLREGAIEFTTPPAVAVLEWQFTLKELDTLRQWFNIVDDFVPAYLEGSDRDLIKKIHSLLASPPPQNKDKPPQTDDLTYIFLTAQRKCWHHDTTGWKEEAFERFDYVECAIFSKPTADLTDRDRLRVESYGTPRQDFIWPDGFQIPLSAPPQNKGERG